MTPTTRMLSPRLRKTLIGIAATLLALLLFLWLALPIILQAQAEKFIRERTGHQLRMARPEFNPLTLRLRLSQLTLTTPGDEQLLAFDQMVVDLSAASALRAALVFDEIRLDYAKASFAELPDGASNWDPLLAGLKSKEEEPEPSKLPRFDIARLNIVGAALDVADRRAGRDFHSRIEPIDLALTDLSTVADDQGRVQLVALFKQGAELRLDAEAALAPLRLAGHVSLKEFDLATLEPYLKEALPARVKGKLGLASQYRISHDDGPLDLRLEQATVDLTELELAPTRVPGTTLAIARIGARGGRFQLAGKVAGLDNFTLEGLRLQTPATRHAASLGKLEAVQTQIDLPQRQARIGRIAIDAGELCVTRDGQGSIDWLRAFDTLKTGLANAGTTANDGHANDTNPAATARRAERVDEVAAGTVATAPWRYRVDELTFNDWTLALQDQGTTPAAELALTRLNVRLTDLSQALDQPLPIELSAVPGGTGQLRIAGTVTPATPAADLKLTLTELPLAIFQPYLAQKLNARLSAGGLSTQGRLTLTKATARKPPAPVYQGDFRVRGLRIHDAQGKTVLLGWTSLATPRLRVTPNQLDIGELRLHELDTQLIIYPDRTNNVAKLLKAPPENGAAAVPPAPTLVTTPDATAPSFTVNITRLRFEDSELEFADHSLVLPFGTRIHSLQGSIGGLSTRPGRHGQLELEGEVDDYGLARASGQIDLFNPTDFMDLAVSFRNVAMPRLSPYTATFAGRRIDSGKLTLDLRYRIKDRQLQGDNQIIIDRLTLGERVESPQAKDLPLNLAIALLEDSEGRIDLGVPVTGNLDDPEFSYGAIVWKAIVNVITKVVTAPFRAIGALFGGDEKLDAIAFEPGNARLTPPEREKLVRVSSALAKRPNLQVTVRGVHTPADRQALQDRQLRRHLLDATGEPAAPEGDPGPVATSDPKVRSALESLYAKRTSGADLAALKEGFRQANPGQLPESTTGKLLSRLTSLVRDKKTLSDSDIAALKGKDFHAVLFERVRASEPLGDEVMTALADTRGSYVFDLLKQFGVAPARLQLAPSAAAEVTDAGVPVVLDLAPLRP